MRAKQFIPLVLTAVISLGVCGTSYAQKNKNIKLANVDEIYTMTLNKKTGNYQIESTQTLTYNVIKKGANHIVSVFHYDDNITIKKSVTGPGDKIDRVVERHDVFNDDSKVAIIDLSDYKEGKRYKHIYQKVCTDARQFTILPITAEYDIEHYHAEIKLPAEQQHWQFESRGMPTPATITTKTNSDGSKSVIIDAYNIPASTDETNVPQAEDAGAYIVCKGSFKSVEELAKWISSKDDVECTIPDVDTFIAPIIKECKSDEEKARAIFAWVQSETTLCDIHQ